MTTKTAKRAEVLKKMATSKTKGARTMAAIYKGKDTVETIAKRCRTTVSSVYWYRSFMKGLGIKLQSAS